VKRCARVIVLFVLLGAVVNVGIAWFVTGWTAWPGGFAALEWTAHGIQWPPRAPDRWPPPDNLVRYESFGWNLDRHVAIVYEEDAEGDRAPVAQYMIEAVRVGWPLRALGWERWVDGQPTQPAAGGTSGGTSGGASGGGVAIQKNRQANPGVWRSGMRLEFQTFGFDPEDGKRLPMFPLWGGFIIDTVFYAVVLWLLVWIPRAVRALIRIFRGRCPKCGYDLRGAIPGTGGGCPECGWGREDAPTREGSISATTGSGRPT
jgi:hypothetical protein